MADKLYVYVLKKIKFVVAFCSHHFIWINFFHTVINCKFVKKKKKKRNKKITGWFCGTRKQVREGGRRVEELFIQTRIHLSFSLNHHFACLILTLQSWWWCAQTLDVVIEIATALEDRATIYFSVGVLKRNLHKICLCWCWGNFLFLLSFERRSRKIANDDDCDWNIFSLLYFFDKRSYEDVIKLA